MSGEEKGRALAVAPEVVAANDAADVWLERFHRGDRQVLEQCYQNYFETVEAAVAQLASRIDQEMLVHDVFVKLIAEPRTRQSFRGGSFDAWLSRVARNLAIDQLRRTRRELLAAPAQVEQLIGGFQDRLDLRCEARLLLQRFRAERLRPEWEGVFVARFVEQRTQRDAARLLGLGRTTLAWRELRIRKLLREFFLTVERER